jgi:hypothetical protein
MGRAIELVGRGRTSQAAELAHEIWQRWQGDKIGRGRPVGWLVGFWLSSRWRPLTAAPWLRRHASC